MLSKLASHLFGASLIAAMITLGFVAANDKQATHSELREKFTKKAREGNYKDAYDGLRKLALDPKNDPKLVGSDLNLAINCLQNLGRVDEIDEFREAVVTVHARNWRLLETAALSFHNSERYGYIVVGKFSRGWHRGGTGRYVSTWQRDRGRALQLMNQALPLAEKDNDKEAVAAF